MKKFFLVGILIIAAFAASSQTARYTVDYTQQADRMATVKAEFTDFPTQNISMFVHPSQGVNEGEAGFIENLKAINGDQTNLAVKYDGMGEWKITGKKTKSFAISYAVRLTHDQHAWFEAGGVDEVGYSTSDGFFSTGYALFLFPAVDNLEPIKDVQVSFILPEGWKASTPWVKQSENTFKVLPDIRSIE